jgi:hypothetical protein
MTFITSYGSSCTHRVIPDYLVRIVVARLMAQIEVVKLVGATACDRLPMMHF